LTITGKAFYTLGNIHPDSFFIFMLPDRNTIKLLRIPFFIFLMPLFLFAVSQAEYIQSPQVYIAFLIIHFLIYPASNGYNSYVDRDEGSIGGLEKPPMPTKSLFHLTLVMDASAIILAATLVHVPFALCLIIYIAASRAYSSRIIRLKKYPYAGFLTVAIFQGAFTFYLSYWAVAGHPLALTVPHILLLCGCTLQIAGAYPLTQIYQHEQDLKDGVVTLSYKLGYKGTFVFTAAMFALCNLCYYLYFVNIGNGMIFYLVQLFFLPIIAYFLYWFFAVSKNTEAANFSNTMRMNWIAAMCMNSCFIVLIFINHFR
jgi:4-hydroxybenzoate polyprenyltransferase